MWPWPSKLSKARREARHFLREARRLLRRYGGRLEEEKRARVAESIDGLAASIAGADIDHIASSLKKVDELLDRHFSFARKSAVREYVESIGKAVLIALVLRAFVVEAFKIPSGSMLPTLQIGDFIFVNKMVYGVHIPVLNKELLHFSTPRRGDVVVFMNPQDDEKSFFDRRDFIKRVVGEPGDLIEVKDERVYVNGQPALRDPKDKSYVYDDRRGDDGPWVKVEGELLEEDLAGVRHAVLRDPRRPHAPYEGPYQVPEGHLFVMGDNRDNSQDGRYREDGRGAWFVPLGHVKGKAMIVWMSWGNAGLRFARLLHVVR